VAQAVGNLCLGFGYVLKKVRRSHTEDALFILTIGCGWKMIRKERVRNLYSLKMKRIYEGIAPEDGFRILVDRLWPRGIKKENAGVDLWLKDIAPSPELRKWFCHDPEKFEDFKVRYLEELETEPVKQKAVRSVLQKLEEGDVTFVYAAKDPVHNHVVVLRDYFLDKNHE